MSQGVRLPQLQLLRADYAWKDMIGIPPLPQATPRQEIEKEQLVESK